LTFKELTMHPYRLLTAGLLMSGAGGYLIFTTPEALPLWFVWLAGPFLWYVGIAVSMTAIAIPLFVPTVTKEERQAAEVRRQAEELPIIRFGSLALAKCGPAGVRSEIPAMGGFIL
jgi:hypothetical protein